jgi:hypothetical protein
MQKTGPEQERQRWETFVAKRMAENAPEQKVVEELVARGADLHLARDFVRRVYEKQPAEMSKPAETAGPVAAARSAVAPMAMDVVIGLVLAAAGIVVTVLMYILDQRSWVVYLGYAVTVVGLVIVGRRALQARS